MLASSKQAEFQTTTLQCPVSQLNLPQACASDFAHQRDVLRVIWQFLSASPSQTQALSALVQFPITQRYLAIRDQFPGNSWLIELPNAFTPSSTPTTAPQHLTYVQAQMYARLMVFLSLRLYKHDDLSDTMDELRNMIDSTTQYNAWNTLHTIRSVLEREIPALKDLLVVTTQNQRDDVEERLDSHTFTSDTLRRSTAASTSSFVDAASIRVELERWREQIDMDEAVEREHHGLTFWDKPHNSYGRIHALRRKIDLYTPGSRIVEEIELEPVASNGHNLAQVALQTYMYVATRGHPILVDTDERAKLSGLLATVTTTTFYDHLRQLKVFLEERRRMIAAKFQAHRIDPTTTRHSTKGRAGSKSTTSSDVQVYFLEWFALPQPFASNLGAELLLRLRKYLLGNENLHDSLTNSVQFPQHWNEWIKPIVAALCFLDPSYWSLSGTTWSAHVYQHIVYMVTHVETLHFRFTPSVKQCVLALVTELETGKTGVLEVNADMRVKVQANADAYLHRIAQGLDVRMPIDQLKKFIGQ